MRKAILLTLALLLTATIVDAQDGAVSQVPKGIDNRTPDKKKEDNSGNTLA